MIDNKLRIVMLFSTPIPVSEGIGSHVLGLAKRLRERGHNITFMTRGNHRGTQEIKYEGFRIVKVTFWPLYPFHVFFHRVPVVKALKNLDPQPDIIHLHSPLVPSLPRKWPTVTTFHSPMLTTTASLENAGLKSGLIKLMGKTTSYRVEKSLLKHSDAIVAVSHGVLSELQQYYGLKTNPRLFTISNSIDTTFFTPGAGSGGEKSLLFVGRLDYGKGLFDLVKSASRVIKDFPGVKYNLVGEGPLEEPLKELAHGLGIENNIVFPGVVHDRYRILHYYQNAYVVIIPSYYESFSIVMHEAMACGKAIITTKASFTKGILDNGENALLVNPKSPDELAEATINLLANGELCRKLGENARKTVVDKMDSDKQTDDVLKVYRYAVEQFHKSKK